MSGLLASGLVLGFWAGISPGPMLALVVSETLRHGSRAGIRVALAPLISDLPVVAASLWLVHELTRFDTAFGLLACLGSLLLGWLGLQAIGSRGGGELALETAPHGVLRRAVMVNLLNPHPALFWFGIGAPLMVGGLDDGPAGPLLFLAGFYLLLVGSKMALALLVGRSRQLLQGRGYRIAMRGVGVLMLLFALLLLRDGLGLLGIGIAP